MRVTVDIKRCFYECPYFDAKGGPGNEMCLSMARRSFDLTMM